MARNNLLKRYDGQEVHRKIHLWLGLTSGLVVFIISLAAALFVFQEELTDLVYHDRVFVPEVRDQKLPLSVLFKRAQQAVPDNGLHDVTIERDPERAYEFETFKKSKTPGLTWFSEYEYRDRIFIDPYTGQVTGVINVVYDPIYLCRVLHQQLLLRYDIGHWITAVGTLIFLVMLISGLVLWWPKNRNAAKQRFTIKWNARWRRVNYDLHNVGGFYVLLLALLLASTGLVWSFKWWTNGIYWLLGESKLPTFGKHEPPVRTGKTTGQPVDVAFADLQTRRATWTRIYFSLPGAEEGEEAELSAFVRFDENSAWDESDSFYYNAETGALHHQHTHQQKSVGEKWRNSNYEIHVGGIYGWPTKILAFLVSLYCASLPVTGFLIWWGRRKKDRRGDVQYKKAVKSVAPQVLHTN